MPGNRQGRLSPFRFPDRSRTAAFGPVIGRKVLQLSSRLFLHGFFFTAFSSRLSFKGAPSARQA
jgi:hypothetical protein